MMLPRHGKRPEAARSIRRHIREAENIRFLRRQPGLELDCELPTEFLELLGKLHKAEDDAAGAPVKRRRPATQRRRAKQ